ncbi:MAG: sensor histidine kinase [Chitinophagaceae bacterium]|nr:sensor histidine kinase [Chitinophagaceae bacterium]
MRLPWLLILFIAFAKPAFADHQMKRDSLFQELAKAKEDSNKALILLSIGYTYERNKPDSAVYFYTACNELSKKLHFIIGQIRYIACYTELLDLQNKYDRSLALNMQGLELAKSIHNNKRIAGSYNNIAVTYFHLRDYEKCVSYYLIAKQMFEEMKDEKHLAVLFSNLAQVYAAMQQKNGLAYEYGIKAITIAKKGSDEFTLEEALVNTSNVLIRLKHYDSALLLLKEAIELAKKLDDKISQVNALVTMNDIYVTIGNYALVQTNANQMNALANEIGNKEGIAQSMFYQSKYQFHQKDFASAKTLAVSALDTAKSNKLNNIIGKTYLLLSDIDLAMGNQIGYNANRQLSDSMQEVILSDKILKNTEEFEVKYSLDKKQSEINDLNNQQKIHKLTLKQRRTIIIALIITLAVIAFAGLLFYRNAQKKKKLLLIDATVKQQRIWKLEKEKQLSATQSILQGQEEERKRLAKDLHDGLGGILSSTKHAFNNMKTNLIITPESAVAFDRSMAMLDKSISELRRVSHNMMPEALLRFGLDTALKDYCNNINQNGSVQLSYQSFEMDDDTVATNKASVVYRIVQELLNNILKHAQAKNALVQLVRKNESLSITVEDDGRGFDASILQANDGIGYLNLQNRVTYLNGTMDIQTALGKGTSVNIEIPNINA